MADASKTVEIIFEGDETSAQASVGRLNAALGKIIEAEKEIAAQSAPAMDGLQKETDEAANSADKLNKQLEETGKKDVVIDRATQAIKTLAASMIAKDFIDANTTFETFIQTMTRATGDAQTATKEWDYLKDASNRLGIELRGATEAYGKLASATKNTALEGDGAKVIFEAFAGTLSQLGLKSTDLNGALTQVAQGISKGKFELEDLKSLAERIPGFFDTFATALGVTNEQLFDMVKKGEIGREELIKLANVLNNELGTAKFDTFTANWNRAKNAITDAFVAAGQGGVWDALKVALDGVTLTIVSVTAGFELLGREVAALAAQPIDFRKWNLAELTEENLIRFESRVKSARDNLIGAGDAAGTLGFNAVEAGKKVEAGMQQGETAAGSLKTEGEKLDELLKALGLNPKKFEDDAAAIIKVFSDLAANPEVRGDQILAGFEATLKRLNTQEQVSAAIVELITAYGNGKMSADEFGLAIDKAQDKQLALDKALGGATSTMKAQDDQLKKNEESTRKAEEAAAKWALEMEKIASNERIKLIEAAVKIDVAQIESDAKIAVAAFDSIGKSVDSTGKLLGELFGILAGGTKDWESWRRITEAIDIEQKRRTEALDMQNKLIQAQIDLAKARTAAIEQGGGIINIDGAGLQPHLEAFMWEILRTIQVRVNSDGLEMLLGL